MAEKGDVRWILADGFDGAFIQTGGSKVWLAADELIEHGCRALTLAALFGAVPKKARSALMKAAREASAEALMEAAAALTAQAEEGATDA